MILYNFVKTNGAEVKGRVSGLANHRFVSASSVTRGVTNGGVTSVFTRDKRTRFEGVRAGTYRTTTGRRGTIVSANKNTMAFRRGARVLGGDNTIIFVSASFSRVIGHINSTDSHPLFGGGRGTRGLCGRQGDGCSTTYSVAMGNSFSPTGATGRVVGGAARLLGGHGCC